MPLRCMAASGIAPARLLNLERRFPHPRAGKCEAGISAVQGRGITRGVVEAKQTIHDILEYFREAARNNRDLGGKFERLIAACLTKDPYYATHFSDVWLWME